MIKYAIPRSFTLNPAIARIDVLGETAKHFRIDPLATVHLVGWQSFDPGMRNRKAEFLLFANLKWAFDAAIEALKCLRDQHFNEAAVAQKLANSTQNRIDELILTMSEVQNGLSVAELARRNYAKHRAEMQQEFSGLLV